MFALRRAAVRAAPLAVRPSVRPFSVLGARLSGAVSHNDVEKNLGPGAQPGTVPTDLEQATGLERQELLAKLEGREFFDMEALDMTHLGTPKNPVVVKSHDPIRMVGCTGYPAESHDTIWINLDKSHEHDRCPECGSVFKMDFIGTEDAGHHH
ncbi:cytochrome c oxidase subunit VB-domain-containing protein [Radiomyces spectabilis]|uniref:cytochrome c oxidase subunit VB-domain-containing protein n=1 Tax=Radiomyces spectabilis TaxID=64574 RepID=UPI00221FBB64|nr:cytochrome c oxidase subunit VB-domain-containing protein [Radiomyces spectabilis]KAI8388831.1 cytochrome c oxidase subunit VB-domain-containing protein [Radiomyces spectabilis]